MVWRLIQTYHLDWMHWLLLPLGRLRQLCTAWWSLQQSCWVVRPSDEKREAVGGRLGWHRTRTCSGENISVDDKLMLTYSGYLQCRIAALFTYVFYTKAREKDTQNYFSFCT
jgi:hypothetical protein